MPFKFPELVFYDEGAHMHNDSMTDLTILVSPDGSLRRMEEQEIVQYGVEIKCPKPAYKYTTTVEYRVSERHICQNVSQIHALNEQSKSNLYMTWSEDSMSLLSTHLRSSPIVAKCNRRD